MKTSEQFRLKLIEVNEVGRTNLLAKGVELPENATTEEIMQGIGNISSGGGGVTYTNIVYNTDNTVTLTDKDGVIHTMSCTYEDGKLIGVTYDGKAVDLTYNGDALVKVGKTSVNIEKAPNESTTTFNIAYGETPPEDTSKLWIKANEPANVSVGSDVEGVGSVANVGYLPTVNSDMGCARVGNKIYLFGGHDGALSNKIYAFDLETETLTALSTTLPTACNNIDCASVGKKIYLFGGYCGGSDMHLDTINVFNTETETITTLSAKLPKRTNDMGCASVGTKIYLFGGMYYSSRYYDLNTIIVFDTETETLTTLSVTLPRRNYGMACASVGTKIYLLGGQSRNNGVYNTIDVFNTETQTVTTLDATLPIQQYNMACSTIGIKIYLFGGYSGGYLDTILVFDTKTETIETLSNTLPIGCDKTGCSAYGNKVYLFGGYGSSALNTINCFTLTHELTQGSIEIQSGLLKNKFNLINTENAQVQIGVEDVYIGNANNEAELCEAYLHNGTEWVVI